MGASVTQRIEKIKQPRGGYVSLKSMDTESLGAGIEALYPTENVNPGLVGSAVDYLTRFMTGGNLVKSFRVSLAGAKLAGDEFEAVVALKTIEGLDDRSICSALKLATYDNCFRMGPWAYRPDDPDPDEATIQNIRTMVERSVAFFKKYGEKTLEGFTFKGGYTDTITTGDGDFLTADTLWDFKTSKNKPTSKHTLQLAVYWRMGLHSVHPEFKNIEFLGIYNPRLNMVYRIPTARISEETIADIETDVIGY